MKLLDLFCGGGGASKGYADVGFEVIGVDIKNHPNYPYPLIIDDIMEGRLDFIFDKFDVIHASPPCQVYSKTKYTHSVGYPDLLEPVTKMLREWADRTGGTYVIENVPGAPMEDPLVLCGTQFGLTATDDDGTPLIMYRHRLFISNVELLWPGRCRHKYYKELGYATAGVYGGGTTNPEKRGQTGYTPSNTVKRELMGLDFLSQEDLHEAIPPAYTRFIGKQLLTTLGSGK
jgi:DNA (cytosine-5)-methyltransferase 1